MGADLRRNIIKGYNALLLPGSLETAATRKGNKRKEWVVR
jgi:hypothetical protein